MTTTGLAEDESLVTLHADRVTMTLFIRPGEHGKYSTDLIERQKENIQRHVDGLTTAALELGKPPPEFVLEIYAVPPSSASLYDAESDYFRQSAALCHAAHTLLCEGDHPVNGLTVSDFNQAMLPEDRAFLAIVHDRCDGKAALNSPICNTGKFSAVIRNSDRRHLQMDTNTDIRDYSALYHTTFGPPGSTPQGRDSINVLPYGDQFLNAHSKLIYTEPTEIMPADGASSPAIGVPSQLAERIRQKSQEHRAKLEVLEEPEATTAVAHFNALSPYSKVFLPALHELGYVGKRPRPADCLGAGPNEYDYPVQTEHLCHDFYRVTCHMVSAVRAAWQSLPHLQTATAALNEFGPHNQDGIVYDAEHIAFIIKLYTGAFKENCYRETASREATNGGHDNLHSAYMRLRTDEVNEADMRGLTGYCDHILECATRSGNMDAYRLLINSIPNTSFGLGLIAIIEANGHAMPKEVWEEKMAAIADECVVHSGLEALAARAHLHSQNWW